MSDHYDYHAVSVSYASDGLVRLRYVRLDGGTKRVVTEELATFEPPYTATASWEEHLLIGVSELLARRDEGPDALA